MRVRFGGAWIADSEDVTLVHAPGRYPVAYFPAGDIAVGLPKDVAWCGRTVCAGIWKHPACGHAPAAAGAGHTDRNDLGRTR